MRERASALLAQQGKADVARKVAHRDVPRARAVASCAARRRRAGLKPAFSILDPADLETHRRRARRQPRIAARARAAQWKISAWKNALVTPAAALRQREDDEELAAARAFCKLRRRAGRVSGGRLRRPHRAAASRCSSATRTRASAGATRCAHVLVDEYQDTNPAQYRLLRAAASGDARRRSPPSATTTRRSTAGAARRSTTSRRCRATIRRSR